MKNFTLLTSTGLDKKFEDISQTSGTPFVSGTKSNSTPVEDNVSYKTRVNTGNRKTNLKKMHSQLRSYFIRLQWAPFIPHARVHMAGKRDSHNRQY